MNRIGRLVAVVVIASVFALPARAGHMETTVTVTPTPAPAVASSVGETAPAVEEGGGEGQETSAGTATEAVLAFVQTILSLF